MTIPPIAVAVVIILILIGITVMIAQSKPQDGMWNLQELEKTVASINSP